MTSLLSTSTSSSPPQPVTSGFLDDAPARLDLEQSLQWCRGLARAHAHRLPGIWPLLEGPHGDDASTLFAFLQRAHDFAKAPKYAGLRSRVLAWWDELLGEAYHDRAEHPVFVALRHVSRKLFIPITDLREVLDAHRLELVRHRFETWSDLERHVRQSCEPLGRLVIRVMGHDDPRLLRLASPFAVGLHLVDLACDVRRDLLAGRLYVPTEDLVLFDVTPSDIESSPSAPKVRELVAFQGARARAFLMQARPLLREMPDGAAQLVAGLWRVALERVRELEVGSTPVD